MRERHRCLRVYASHSSVPPKMSFAKHQALLERATLVGCAKPQHGVVSARMYMHAAAICAVPFVNHFVWEDICGGIDVCTHDHGFQTGTRYKTRRKCSGLQTQRLLVETHRHRPRQKTWTSRGTYITARTWSRTAPSAPRRPRPGTRARPPRSPPAPRSAAAPWPSAPPARLAGCARRPP